MVDLPKIPKLQIIVVSVFLTMVGIQIIARLLAPWSEGLAQIRMGPDFLLAGVAVSAITVFALVIKKLRGLSTIEGKDIFFLVIVVALTIVMFMYLEQFVPEIFASSHDSLRQSLQSMIGGG